MNGVYAGKVFTRLTVVGPVSRNKWGHPRSECRCVCGNTVIVCDADLIRSNKSTKSCGCYNRDCTRQRNRENCEKKHARFVDLTGRHQKNGMLRAVKVVGFPKSRHARWSCICDCGNTCVVLSGAFLSETTQSCGCKKIENDTHRFGTANPNFKTGLCVVQRAA
jgi:hypothetical protein